jgi:integrase
MTLHKQHLISNTSGLSIKPNGNYLFRFVISDKLKSFFNRFEFKKTYKQDFYVLDIIKDIEHIKAQYKHIKKMLLSNELSKDKKQELINRFLADNLNKDYEFKVIDLNNDSIQNKISVTRDNLNNTEHYIKDTAKDLLSSIGLDINSLDKNKKKNLILKLKQVQIHLFNQVLYLDNTPTKAKRKTISNDITIDEPKIISVNTAIEMYQKYYEDTASTSSKTYFEKINALEYFKAVIGSQTSVKSLKKSDIDRFVYKYLQNKPKGKLPKYKDLDSKTIIKLIDNNEIKEDEKIKLNSVNKYYQHINGFINFLFTDGLIDKNIAQVKITQELQNKDTLNTQDVINITNHLKESTNQIHYQLFMVYLLTGLRSNELWQSDIIELDNILAFNVNGTKTKEAKRVIPIHSNLIDLNINKNWLDELKHTYNNCRYITRKLNDEIKPFLNDKQTLYSTRHWFVTELLRNDISENIIDVLVGHSDKKNLTKSTYGRDAFTIGILKDAVESLKLPLL